MEITPHQVRFLEQIASKGIHFETGHWALGNIILQPDEIEAFVTDPDQFAADYLGVTKELLNAWGEFQNRWQCLGFTKKRERCKERVANGRKVSHPSLFSVTNPDCYCARHKPA